MKLNFGKRLILFLHWLLSLIVAAVWVCNQFFPQVSAEIEKLLAMLGDYRRVALIAFACVYAVASIAALCLIFKRGTKKSERGFITVDSSDTGRVRITVGAIEQMVKQAIGTVDGVADMRINIASLDEAIAINVNVSILNGVHVPTVTLNMQRAIRQFVEMNCGVAVRSVSISVQTVVSPGEGGKRGKRGEVRAVPEAQPAPVVTPVEPGQEPEPEPAAPAYEPEPEPVSDGWSEEAQLAYAEPVQEPVVQPEEAPAADDAEEPAAADGEEVKI